MIGSYSLVGESRYYTRPDLEFSDEPESLKAACKRAIEILDMRKYQNRFWAISIFRDGEYRGIVDKAGNSYRYQYKARFVRLNRDGSFRK